MTIIRESIIREPKITPREELKKALIRENIEELKTLVNVCDPESLRNAFVLGRMVTSPQDDEEIRNIVKIYSTSCQCLKKSPEVELIHRLIERYPKLK